MDTQLQVWRSPKVEVRTSPMGGRGVFAREPIEQGEVVAVKVGHVVQTAEVLRLTEEIGDFSLQIHDDFFLSPRTAEEVDDSVIMINHSCDANVGFEGVTYVAIRDIELDEELCHDYAMMRTAPYELDCLCGATTCRGVVTHHDWARADVQAQYGRWFMPHILRRIDQANAAHPDVRS